MKCYQNHPSLDLLELYALERVPAAELTQLEEHLLVCDRCRTMLGALEREIAVLRAALQTQCRDFARV